MLPHRTKTGILLINLGTPDGTDYWSMRRYLKEFLWDKRVVEIPRPLWWLILNGVILPFRPKKSGKAYQSIWNMDKNESPLRTISRDTYSKISDRFASNEAVVIDWAMRYGTPSLEEKINGLLEKGCDKILLFPLYPQYSASTTASVNDKAFEILKSMRWQPTIRTVAPYYNAPIHIKALVTSVKDHLSTLDFKPDMVLASFHGIPKFFVKKGDPYQNHCQQTFKLLKQALAADGIKMGKTYQSRLGRTPWLQPYTDKTLIKLPQKGIKNIAVMAPGFAADCVETLEEINIEGRDEFLAHGGENFSLIPCLNDSSVSIDMLAQIINDNIQGWA